MGVLSMKKHFSRKKGQNLTEYGLILVLVAVAAIGIMGAFGTQIKAKMGMVTAALNGDQAAYSSAQDRSKEMVEKANEFQNKGNSMAGSAESDIVIEDN